MYDLAKRSAGSIAAEVVTSSIGAPGAGIASGVTAALMRNKSAPIRAADELISSPDFIRLVKSNTPNGATRFTSSQPFKKFIATLIKRERPNNLTQWVIRSMQAAKQVSPQPLNDQEE